MAVDSDHTPFLHDSGRADRLCRELQLAGIEVGLPVNHDGALASGVSLSVNAAAARGSGSATAQLRDRAFAVLASGPEHRHGAGPPSGFWNPQGRP